jgi:hypothetical protein
MAPRLKPGTGFHLRGSGEGIEGRTEVSRWHRVIAWWGRHHLDREDNGEWRDESGWHGGGGTVGPAGGHSRADRRDDLRLARHAQSLREEEYTKGGRVERQMFYGGGEHMGAGVERQVRTTAADEHRRDERVRRYYTVTYTSGGAVLTQTVGAFTPGQARRKVDTLGRTVTRVEQRRG